MNKDTKVSDLGINTLVHYVRENEETSYDKFRSRQKASTSTIRNEMATINHTASQETPWYRHFRATFYIYHNSLNKSIPFSYLNKCLKKLTNLMHCINVRISYINREVR